MEIFSPIFNGITNEEFDDMKEISCMHEKSFRKNEIIFHMGDITQKLGIILEGSVLIENNDLWGNRSILSNIGAGEVFAETYALCKKPMTVEVVAGQDCNILFLDLEIIFGKEYENASWHIKMLANLLDIFAEKNLVLSSRIFCTSSKNIRGRLLTFFSQQVVRSGSMTFTVSFNRQQMADYLNVDRSALSKELGRMKNEGMIEFKKNKFTMLNIDLN